MHGTGALNIDGCRIGTTGGARLEPGAGGFDAGTVNALGGHLNSARSPKVDGLGRWPANVVLDPAAAAELDAQSGVSKSPTGPVGQGGRVGFNPGDATETRRREGEGVGYGDTGGASRFLYVAKAPARERPLVDGHGHPTVKPLALMRWLVRLVTPPGGTVLEPFLGSGTTAEACIIEGFLCIGIERDTEHMAHTKARLAKPIQPDIFGGAS